MEKAEDNVDEIVEKAKDMTSGKAGEMMKKE